MGFSEKTKLEVMRKSHFRCCICEGVHPLEIHHIIPQAEGGPDEEENAAPLCNNCHDAYGDNPIKRKWIREKRNHWFELCAQQYASDENLRGEITALLRAAIEGALGEQAASGQGVIQGKMPEMPRKAEHFVGREKEIARLRAEIKPGMVVTLTGPRGIGKTALVAEVMDQLTEGGTRLPVEFPEGVIFHRIHSKPDIQQLYEHIVDYYGGELEPTPQEAAERVLRGKAALIILDGAEAVSYLDEILEIKSTCGVIITSRSRADVHGTWVEMKVLKAGEARELLMACGRGSVDQDEVADQICTYLGRLPLAVILAGKYLFENEEPADKYLAWLESTPLAELKLEERAEQSVPFLLEGSKRQEDALKAGKVADGQAREESVSTRAAIAKVQAGVGHQGWLARLWQQVPRWVWGLIGGAVVLALLLTWVIPGLKAPATPQPKVVALTTEAVAILPLSETPTSTHTPTQPSPTSPSPTATQGLSSPTSRPPTATPSRTVAPTPTLTPQMTETTTGLPAKLTDEAGVPMVLVPVGTFEMGGDADTALAECEKFFARDYCQRDSLMDTEPVHTVRLDYFYIDQYEVTNARYAACVAAGDCAPPSDPNSFTRKNYYGSIRYAEYPVIFVSWYDAQAYCEWRGARLPTEAEWEKAAGGTKGWTYPWGDTFDGAKANFCDRNCSLKWTNPDDDDGYADTAPVGSYPGGASQVGALDMAGNVREWVADWYQADYYVSSPDSNPPGAPSGGFRVLRGGSWGDRGNDLGVHVRFRDYPTVVNNTYGFRCARDATLVSPVDGMRQVYIPAGAFTMGSDEGEADQKPSHTVELEAFWMDQTEVTNAMFSQFVEASNYTTTAEKEGESWVFTPSDEWVEVAGADWQHPQGPGSDLSGLSDHPVVQVSWRDAGAYCKWAGRRLPTEAEWEKAARGTTGYTYPWGDRFDCHKGNFDDETLLNGFVVPGGAGCDGYDRTAPAGSFPQGASPYGVLDMAGNVWELVVDWYDVYPGGDPDASENFGKVERVMRGGGWLFHNVYLRTTYRSGIDPNYTSPFYGFRCASDTYP